MKESAFYKVTPALKAQQLLVVALFASGVAQAAETELDIGVGFGSDDNIFFSEMDEQRETFGMVDIDFEYDNDLSDNLELSVDAIYEDKNFSGESDARDKLFSGRTQLVYKADGYRVGVQLAPQYRQFVTSETDGDLVVGEKQRVSTLKARTFARVDINDSNSVEVGFERKAKDYKDTESDYDADIVDLRLRSRISDEFRVSIGVENEQRDYDDRLAVTALGVDVPGEKLEIDRTTWFVKGTWRPASNQKYSLEYKSRQNEDDFQEYYGHDKDQVTLRTEYEWDNGVVLETKLKFSDKSYDEQLDDEGGSLDADKTGVDVELSVPLSVLLGKDCDNWYTRFTYEWDENDSGEADRNYEKNAYWFTVHKVF